VASEWKNLGNYFAQAGPVTLLLNVVMMVLAYYVARLFRLGTPQRTAVVLEGGLQNGTLAIFVAVTLLGNTTMMVPGGIYSLLMFVTAGAFMFVAHRQAARMTPRAA